MIDAENALKWEELNLDYEGENKYASFFSSTGNLHTYPAKAVPEMVSDLIKKVMSIKSIKTVLDPFVGSGTTALESKYLGLDFWGSDLNPLAVLLSKTKVLTIDNTNYTKKRLSDFVQQVKKEYPDARLIPFYTFNSINYWFKEENIRELSFLKYKMDQFINNANKVNREMYALILLTAFSSTIRRVSLTRNGEFKLYRMSPSDIERFSINAIDEFEDAVTHLLDMLVVANNSYKKETISTICLQNAKSLNYLKNNSIDLVVTSPPYGDSKTTVAYGEFSKLSLQWMEDLLKKYIRIEVADCNCDEQLLGGRKSEWSLQDEKDFYKSNEVVNLETQIQSRIQEKKRDLARAKEVLEEMRGCINNKRFVSIDLLHKNEILYQLISERVRLDIYRKIKNSKAGLKDKETKKLAKKNAGEYMKQMENIYSSKYVIRQTHLEEKLDKVTETLERNEKSIQKRKEDVLVFLKDLYKVVLETDRVMKKDGFQVWIVGHRTVMGKITINMEGILKDWFLNMGYECEASLSRKYSFKRMPHHINSTIERCEEVDTMMNEYILVVRKK
jgi:DNA modification methylase